MYRKLSTTLILLAITFNTLLATAVYSLNNPCIKDNEDYRYVIQWSREISGVVSSIALYDYNGDSVYDIVSSGRHRLVVIDPLTNNTLYNYVLDEDSKIYTLQSIDDVDGDGFREIAIVYVNESSNTINLDLVEPYSGELLVTQSYSLPSDAGEQIPTTLNGIIDYGSGLMEVVVSYLKLEGYSVTQKTYVYKFDLFNGEEQPVDVINDKLYIIWTNSVPADLDGDGFVEVSHDTVKAYFRIDIQIFPPSIEIESSISVYPEGSPWSWSKSYTNKVPGFIFRPYSTPTAVLDTLLVSLSISNNGVEPESLDIIGYRLADGYQRYSISFSFDEYSPGGISILGGLFSIALISKDDRIGYIRFYDGYTGCLENTVNIGYVGEGYNVTTSSIGDFGGDGDRDLLVGRACDLLLVDTSGVVDYLGSMEDQVMVVDRDTIFYSDEEIYVVTVYMGDTGIVRTIDITVNDTTPPVVEILYPENNTLVETPFYVNASVFEDYSIVTSVSLKVYRSGELVLEKPMEFNGTYAYTLVENLDDGEYTLFVVAVNDNGLIGYDLKYVTVDNTPPVIEFISIPTNGTRILDQICVEMNVIEQHLDRVEVYVNSELYSVIRSNGSISYEIVVEDKPDGNLSVLFKAKDLLNHTTTTLYQYHKDTSPPIVETNVSDYSVWSGVSTISISVWDNTSAYTTIYFGDKEVCSINGTGSYTVDIDTTKLPDGVYSLVIESIDYLGLEEPLKTILEYSIIVDNNPPSLTIVSINPENNSRILFKLDYTIRVEDIAFDHIDVIVNGELYTVIDVNGTVIGEINLTSYPDGEVDIQFIAYDLLGRKSSLYLHYVKDTSSPIVETNISDREILCGIIYIAISIDDLMPVNTTVYLDGEPIISYSDTGYYVFSLDTTILDDGEHTLYVKSIDYIGTDKPFTKTLYITIIVDNNPPILNTSSPCDYVCNEVCIIGSKFHGETYPLTLHVEDTTLYSITIIVNGVEHTIVVNDTVYSGLVNISLRKGFNSIEVIAKDKLGREVGTTLSIYLNTYNPVIELKEYSKLGNKSLLLDLFLKHNCPDIDIPLSRIVVEVYKLVNGEWVLYKSIPFDLGGVLEYRFRKTIDLGSDGVYHIIASLYDVSGCNTSFIIERLLLDTTPPSIDASAIVTDSLVHISWNVTDELSGIKTIELIVDNNTYIVTDLDNATLELTPGRHHIMIRAIDNMGNNRTYDLGEITIEETKTPTTTPPETTPLTTLTTSPVTTPIKTNQTTTKKPLETPLTTYTIGIAIIVLVIATITIYMYRRKRV